MSPSHVTTSRRPSRNLTLVDLLDRLLEGGVVVHGDLILAAADIDLVALDVRLLVKAIEEAAPPLDPATARRGTTS